jgi:hypothetical protein
VPASNSYLVLAVPQSIDGVYFSESFKPSPRDADGRLLQFDQGVETSGGPRAYSVKTDRKTSEGRREYKGAFFDALPNQGLEFVISPRFHEALVELGVTNLQTFPLTVTCAKTRKKHD